MLQKSTRPQMATGFTMDMLGGAMDKVHGLSNNAKGAGAAAGGAMAYAYCKSKCPGESSNILANLPGVGTLTSIGSGIQGGIGSLGAGLTAVGNFGKTPAAGAAAATAATDEDGETAEEDAAAAAAAAGGAAGFAVGAAPKEQDTAKLAGLTNEETRDNMVLTDQLEKGDNSTCRLNCKIKSLMVAAAAAGAAGLKPAGFADALDDCTLGLAALAASRTQLKPRSRRGAPSLSTANARPPAWRDFLQMPRP